jgi:glycosyltransferase involved in cell wall biosynthesis
VNGRVLFVVNADWFFVSHRLALARAVRAAGYEVGVCAGQSEAHARITAEGFPFFPLPIDRGGTSAINDAATLMALTRVYRRYRPNIAHHVTIKPVLYGSLAARIAGVPATVNAISGLGYAFIPRTDDRLRNQAFRGGLRAAYRLALSGSRTRTIFQNADDREAFVEQRLVRRVNTRLIRGSGVDLEKFKEAPLPPYPFTALVPSRLLWDKGIGEFVQAATSLRKRWPDARFVLLGRLDYGNPAAIREEQIQRWVSDGLVEWWGSREHEFMPEAYAQAHVVVLPSYREGLPLALAEAAATSRPVITTDVPGCRDTVLDGKTGWVVKARDAVSLTAALEAALSADLPTLAAMGRAGRQLAALRFSIQSVVGATLASYSELMG